MKIIFLYSAGYEPETVKQVFLEKMDMAGAAIVYTETLESGLIDFTKEAIKKSLAKKDKVLLVTTRERKILKMLQEETERDEWLMRMLKENRMLFVMDPSKMGYPALYGGKEADIPFRRYFSDGVGVDEKFLRDTCAAGIMLPFNMFIPTEENPIFRASAILEMAESVDGTAKIEHIIIDLKERQKNFPFDPFTGIAEIEEMDIFVEDNEYLAQVIMDLNNKLKSAKTVVNSCRAFIMHGKETKLSIVEAMSRFLHSVEASDKSRGSMWMNDRLAQSSRIKKIFMSTHYWENRNILSQSHEGQKKHGTIVKVLSGRVIMLKKGQEKAISEKMKEGKLSLLYPMLKERTQKNTESGALRYYEVLFKAISDPTIESYGICIKSTLKNPTKEQAYNFIKSNMELHFGLNNMISIEEISSPEVERFYDTDNVLEAPVLN